jgi:hypothetical protein
VLRGSSRLLRSTAGVGIAAVVALGVAACGGADDGDADRPSPEERAVAGDVRALQRAFAEGDLAGVCEQMTRAAQVQAGLIAHGKPEQCVPDLREAFGVLREGGGVKDTSATKVVGARVNGNRAIATVRLGDWTHDVPLSRQGGRWKLNSFFGTPEEDARRVAETVRGQSFPAANDTAVEGLDGDGGRCFDFTEDTYPEIEADCQFRAEGTRVGVSILTAFGRFKFADCIVRYTALVDGQGRTWTTEMSFDWEINNGCADVNQCVGDGGSIPWRGRIRSDGEGAFVHEMNVCMRTCVGFYTGTLEMRLERSGERWRTEAVDSSVGASGFRLDGPLRVNPIRFDLPAAS